MHRFHLPSLKFDKNVLIIREPRVVFQLNKVLRMKVGASLHVFDGEQEALVQIQSLDRKQVTVEFQSHIENQVEAQLKVSLYQGIPKKPALFELVVQKATELGVTDIYPLITERTENRRMTKFDRLNLIALEATEQCGRLKIPQLHHPVNFEEVIPQLKNAYIGYEYESGKLLSDYHSDLQKAQEIQLIIGPEGGLSESEISLAKSSGLHSFSLGRRILRTETAAISSLAYVLLGRWGEVFD